MPKIRLDQLHVRLRGVSVTDARRAVRELGPALTRQLQSGGASPSTVVGPRPLADRIAAPLAARVRGAKR